MEYQKIIDIIHEMRPIVFDGRLASGVAEKGENDYVTQVDLTISRLVKQRLGELYSDVGFMSEEEAEAPQPDTRWILDPIDGTANLVYGLNTSSISLALMKKGVIDFGVVYDPYRQETFHAVRGQGAFLNGTPMPKAPRRTFDRALIEFGAGYTDKRNSGANFALAREVFEGCTDLRRMCSTALAICYIAAGRIDGYFERKIKPWDYAAAGLILEECGGVMTDWQGRPMDYRVQSPIICGTVQVHRRLLDICGRHEGQYIG